MTAEQRAAALDMGEAFRTLIQERRNEGNVIDAHQIHLAYLKLELVDLARLWELTAVGRH